MPWRFPRFCAQTVLPPQRYACPRHASPTPACFEPGPFPARGAHRRGSKAVPLRSTGMIIALPACGDARPTGPTMPPILMRRTLAATLCIFPLAATAQTSSPSSVQTLGDIVVTASRTPEALSDVVGDVTVVGPQELQAAGTDSVAQILSRQPGIQLATTGGPQTATTIFIPGTNSHPTDRTTHV